MTNNTSGYRVNSANLIKRTYKCWKENGFVYTFNKALEHILSFDIESIKLISFKQLFENNYENLSKITDKNVIVFYGKNAPVSLLQRPLQMMRYFDNSFLKFFLAKHRNPVFESEHNLNIIPFELNEFVVDRIGKKDRLYIMFNDYNLFSEIKNIQRKLYTAEIIFDFDVNSIIENPAQKRELIKAVKGSSFVIYSHPKSLPILNEIDAEKEYHFISNGCESEKFASAAKRISSKPNDIPLSTKPIMGYYGFFNEHLDFSLIKKIADDGKYHLLMICTETESAHSDKRFKHENITWLDLPASDKLLVYLSWFDVCLLPFKDSSYTRNLNPSQLWEFMATGKRIFTSVDFGSLYSYLSVDVVNIVEDDLNFVSSNYNADSAALFDFKLIGFSLKNIIMKNSLHLTQSYYDAMNWYNFNYESYNPYDFITFLDKNKVEILDISYKQPVKDKIPLTIIFMLFNETAEEVNNLLSLDNIGIVDEILVYVCKNKNKDNVIKEFNLPNLKYFYQEDRKNYSDGRNILLKAAKNELILSLDVGNQYPKDYITDMYVTQLNNSDADMICSICENSWVIDDYNKSFFYPSSKNILIKKSITQKADYYPTKISKFGEDTLFDLYYYQNSHKILFNKAIKVIWNLPVNTTTLRTNYGYGNMNIGIFFEKYKEDYYYFQALYQKLLHYKKHNTNNNRIIILNSLVAIDDMGGGQRCTKLTKAFNEAGYYVLFNNIFPNLNKSSDRTQIDVDPYLLSCFYLNKFNYHIIDLIVSLGLKITVINEAPYPELMDFCKYVKNKQASAVVVYDIIDNWNTDLGWFWYKEEIEQWFLQHADKITSSSMEFIRLYTDKSITYVSNGVDDKTFDVNSSYKKPADLPANKNKNIIYYGSVTEEWFDFDLLRKIADLGNLNVILIGAINEDIINKHLKHEHIYILGKKINSELPAYLCYSDVTIIPFVINDITIYTNPLKIYEYLAMHKPVVLSNMVEVPDYNNSFKCNDHNEFVAKIKELVATDYKFKDEPKLPETYYSSLIKRILHN